VFEVKNLTPDTVHFTLSKKINGPRKNCGVFALELLLDESLKY
jgi:hypothetical protein